MKKCILILLGAFLPQLQAASVVVPVASNPVGSKPSGASVGAGSSPAVNANLTIADKDQKARYWGCMHPTQPNSKADCDAIVTANDYVSMVQLCSSSLKLYGNSGVIDFCGLVTSATGASVIQAIGANTNQNGVDLGYICSHTNLPGSSEACDLLSKGASAMDYNSAVSAVQLCATGEHDDMCNIIAQAGSNANVVKAIGDNSNTKGVQLGYMCMHPTAANNPGAKQACALVLQGTTGGNYDAAFSAVQACAAGSYPSMCSAIESNSSNANVIQAIGDNSNTKGVQLGYSCMHPASGHNPGSQQACDLVKIGTIGGNYDSAYSAVQACSASGYDNLCSALAQAGTNANVVKAIGDNANGKGVLLGNTCMHSNLPGYKQACTLLAQGVSGDSYDASYSAVQACSAGGYDALCAALTSAGTNANVVKAIGDNSNHKGNQLGYRCMHANLGGASQSCVLLIQGVQGYNYDAAFSAVQVCSAGSNNALCDALAKAGTNQNIVQAVGDNSNSKGVQLGNTCMHNNLPGHSQSCVLLAQGTVGGNSDASLSAVEVCSSGLNDALCQAISQNAKNNNVINAIVSNQTSGVNLGYACSHGSQESCTLLSLIPGGELAAGSPANSASSVAIQPPAVTPVVPVAAAPISYGALAGQCSSGTSSACQAIINGANDGDELAIDQAQNLCGVSSVPANFQGPVCNSYVVKTSSTPAQVVTPVQNAPVVVTPPASPVVPVAKPAATPPPAPAVIGDSEPSASDWSSTPSGSSYTYRQLLNWCGSVGSPYCGTMQTAAASGDPIAQQVMNYNCKNPQSVDPYIWELCKNL